MGSLTRAGGTSARSGAGLRDPHAAPPQAPQPLRGRRRL